MNEAEERGAESVEAENERLRAEVERLQRYKKVVEGEGWIAKQLARLMALVWISPSLALAIRRWIEARRAKKDRLPLTETAELAAALLRRFIRVGMIAALLAILPTLLLLWQNTIMLDQNQYLRQQITEMRSQADRTEAQALETQITHYFDLLTSNDEGKFWTAVSFFRSPGVRKQAITQVARLALTAGGHVRCVALSALQELIEQRTNSPHGIAPSYVALSSVLGRVAKRENLQTFAPSSYNCPELPLVNVDLNGLKFKDADFSRSSLEGVNFSKTILVNASFDDTQINYVDFRGAVFGGTSFHGAYLNPELKFSENALRHSHSVKLLGAVITDGALDALKRADADVNWAICLGLQESDECRQYHAHLRRRKQKNTSKLEPPSGCPKSISGPIILHADPVQCIEKNREWIHFDPRWLKAIGQDPCISQPDCPPY